MSSAAIMALVMGTLYLGWYRWPGWYLANASQVALVMLLVDVALGPLVTFVIASPLKSRAALARDVGVIVVIQLAALTYGTLSLWNGRPLYYVFSNNCLSLVQAYDIASQDAAVGRERNPDLAPHWYSLPRWIWVPADHAQSQKPGADMTAMPVYYQSYAAGFPAMREQLKKLDDIRFFFPHQKKILQQRMQEAGMPTDQVNGLAFTGRAHPLLAIFDPATMQMIATFKFD